MKRFLSYIYPITKKWTSKLDHTLELTWYNGKKYLNTKNANYSYGTLQKILKFGLTQVDLSSVENILVLGLGGGSVIQTLRNDFNCQKEITAVEIDPVVVAIAKNEFAIVANNKLKIICIDALDFMQNNKRKYDLIIVDLFIDTVVPPSFFKLNFWFAIARATSAKGNILFNAALGIENNNEINSIALCLEKEKFKTKVFRKVEGSNTILQAVKLV